MSEMNELRFDGQVVVITGGGRGMGKSHSLMFAERGAKVVCCDNGCEMNGDGSDLNVAQAVVNEIKAKGGEAIASTRDLSTKEGCKALIADAIEAYGRVDIVIHNAGICYGTLIPDITDEDLKKNFSIHYLAGLYLTQEVWPYFVKQNGGNLVYVISAAGMFGNATFSHYGSAKMASYGLMRTAHIEGQEHNIRVNCIQVGAISRMCDVMPPAVVKWFEKYMDPKGVSAALLWMVHKDNTLSGEVINALGWHCDRMLIASTGGYTQVGYTPEDLRAHEKEILATDQFFPSHSAYDDLMHFSDAIAGIGGEPVPF